MGESSDAPARRILHVTQCRGGGVPRAVDMLAAVDPDDAHLLLTPEPHAHDAAVFTEIRPLGDGLDAVRTVRRAVRELRPDVVHAHSSWAGMTARVAGLGVPVVYQPHAFVFDGQTRRPAVRAGFRAVESVLARRTAAFVVLTPHEQRLARSLRARVPAVLVPNRPSVERAATVAPAGPPVVAMVGRISPQKDPAFFARVARDVTARRPDVSFVWIGDGDPTLSAGLSAAGVRITGWVRGPALADELSAATVYFHSANYEGFPLSVLDAAALDRPVVARRIDALADSPLHLFDTEAACADAVLRAVSDPGYRAELQAAGELLLAGMNSTTMAAALTGLYDTVAPRPLVRTAP
ncbi:glycosyltransferase [Nakamurella deserti]|uniref:glycosyltransferase n=1 Tax=Nakamurella deserti TaxID=2164074 RepID=UPI000DBE0BCD|nr:glycosyltransferase [Nakamurella deserti]